MVAIKQIMAQPDINLLVITGGHRYDTACFHSIFSEFKGIKTDTFLQPFANQMIAAGKTEKNDVILFYDSWKTISDEEIKAYKKLLKRGTGLVFMHHALVSYQDWPEFQQIIGGKYKKPKYKGDTIDLSDFKHDIILKIDCTPEHPITKDIESFEIFDEGYMNIDIIPEVMPLLTTKHEFCDEITGWVHRVKKSRIVYLMPGHARPAFENEAYKKIIRNAIFWAAKRTIKEEQ